MTMLDLGPAAQRMTALLDGVTDLDGPTPCADTSVGDLLDHVDGLSLAFTMAAQKAGGDGVAQPASADASKLGDDWRTRIPGRLLTLVEAWRDPEAWTGMTKAGGVDLPPTWSPRRDRCSAGWCRAARPGEAAARP